MAKAGATRRVRYIGRLPTSKSKHQPLEGFSVGVKAPDPAWRERGPSFALAHNGGSSVPCDFSGVAWVSSLEKESSVLRPRSGAHSNSQRLTMRAGPFLCGGAAMH